MNRSRIAVLFDELLLCLRLTARQLASFLYILISILGVLDMFTKLIHNDMVMEDGSLFGFDEVQYNLLFRISEGSDALCLKTLDDKMIFAQTPGQNGL